MIFPQSSSTSKYSTVQLFVNKQKKKYWDVLNMKLFIIYSGSQRQIFVKK